MREVRRRYRQRKRGNQVSDAELETRLVEYFKQKGWD